MRPRRLEFTILFATAWAGVAFMLPAFARAAEAVPPPASIELEYSAPAGCPSKERVRRELQRLLASSAVSSPIESEIVVVERRGRFELSLTLHSPVSGERTISHARCALAVRAAALIVAISIDPDVATRDQNATDGEDLLAEDPKPSDVSEPQSNAATPPAPAPTPASKADATESWPTELPEPSGSRFTQRFVAQLGALVERGLAPQVTPGALVGLGLQGRHWRTSIVSAVLPKSEAWVAESDVGARFLHLWLDLELCVRSGGERLNAGLCAFLRQTWAFASGMGADENLKASGNWQTFGAGPHVALRLNPWFELEAALQLEAPLQRPRFVIENLEETVFRPETLGGAASLAGVVSF